MKNKLYLFALLTVLIFGLSSCEDAERERIHPFTVENAPLTFLKVGNEWVYQVETWEYYNWGERSFDTVKLKIVSQSGNFYKVIKNDEEENYEYWYYDGDVFKVEIEEIGNEGSLFLYRNLEDRQEWNYNDTMTVRAWRLDWLRRDTVPAGTFFTFELNMWHIDYIHNSPLSRTIRFNKGVGIVREERRERYWVDDGTPWGKWVRTNYNITLISKNF